MITSYKINRKRRCKLVSTVMMAVLGNRLTSYARCLSLNDDESKRKTKSEVAAVREIVISNLYIT